MNHTGEMLLAVYVPRTKELLNKVRLFLESIGIDNISNLPRDIGGNRPIRIVFAGQYSAGKSTIIRALTGNKKIAVGVGRTTGETHPYSWNGLEIVDTPGIQAGCSDHDKKAYDAIRGADILAYVVTQRQFNIDIAKKFRQLLKDTTAKRTVLIVNKMDKADVGNTKEAQIIKLNDLERITNPYKLKIEGPYTAKDVRCVFIAAKSYLTSLEQSDKDMAAFNEESSNYHGLIETLNGIATDNNIYSRLTTPLYQTKSFLQDIQVTQTSTGNKDVDKLQEMFIREKRMYLETKWELERAIVELIKQARTKIREIGSDFSYKATSGTYKDEDALETDFQKTQDEVQKISDDCVEKIKKEIEKIEKNHNKKIYDSYTSEECLELLGRLAEEWEKPDMDNVLDKDSAFLRRLFGKDKLQRVGAFFIKHTEGTKGVKTLRRFNGTDGYEFIKKMGHLFGHKFKPHGIQKLVGTFNKAGKVLKVAGVLIDCGLLWYDKKKDDKREEELRKIRKDIRAGFNNYASQFEESMNKQKEEIIKESCLDKIDEINASIDAINEERAAKDENCRKLKDLENECTKLIEDINLNC